MLTNKCYNIMMSIKCKSQINLAVVDGFKYTSESFYKMGDFYKKRMVLQLH